MRKICQHCGQNAANFYYKSVVNGQVTEVELCSSCAQELGYADALKESALNRSFFDLFRPDFSFGYSPLLQLGRIAPAAEKETAAVSSAGEEKAAPEPPAESAAANPWQKQRELNVLKAQLQQAVEEENFEQAILLRDEIRQKEAQ